MVNLLLAADEPLFQTWQYIGFAVLIGLIVFWVVYRKRQANK
jgi:hypothetical protein